MWPYKGADSTTIDLLIFSCAGLESYYETDYYESRRQKYRYLGAALVVNNYY